MSIHVEHPHQLESLPNRVLLSLLRDLEEEERVLSSRRRVLHEQIDDSQARNDAPGPTADLLGSLQQEERELSERRLQLHLEISRFRIERGNRLRGLRAQLRVVESASPAEPT
jgi:hypothetical protein